MLSKFVGGGGGGKRVLGKEMSDGQGSLHCSTKPQKIVIVTLRYDDSMLGPFLAEIRGLLCLS